MGEAKAKLRFTFGARTGKDKKNQRMQKWSGVKGRMSPLKGVELVPGLSDFAIARRVRSPRKRNFEPNSPPNQPLQRPYCCVFRRRPVYWNQRGPWQGWGRHWVPMDEVGGVSSGAAIDTRQ